MATLDDIIASFKNPFWLGDPAFAGSFSLDPGLADSSLVRILNQLQHCLATHRVGRAVNWLALGQRLLSDTFLSQVRRHGLLRPSKYRFWSTTLESVARTVHDHADIIGLTASSLEYLNSIRALTILSQDILAKEHRLVQFLRSNRRYALKGFLAAVDFLFMQGRQPNRAATGAEIDFYPKEDIAEGLSYIFHIFARTFGLSDADLQVFHAKDVSSGLYSPYLVDACIIRKFQEWEILIDILGYSLRAEPRDGRFTLSCADTRLSQSYHLGYIQAEMRRHVIHRRHAIPEALSIETAGGDFLRRFGDQFVEYVAKPLRRFRYHLPLIPEFLRFFGDDAFFREELVELHQAAEDNFAVISEMLGFKIYKDVTLHDLVKMQRLLLFLRSFVATHLLKHLTPDPELVFQSLIPRFAIDIFYEPFMHIMSYEKFSQAIELLSWKPKSGRVFDIQYQPVLNVDRVLTVPVNMLATANLIRNSLQLRRERITDVRSTDPIGQILEGAIREQGWDVRRNVPYRFQGISGEIDVITYHGSRLFAFECKTSLFPCNVHEIRTSFDHVAKGAAQLDRLASLWGEMEFREYLTRLLSWRLLNVCTLTTCIVTGNRMFAGYRTAGGHAVRSAYELERFVSEGRIGLNDQWRCLWDGERLTAEDLHAFIQNDRLHKYYFESMERRLEEYPLGKHIVYREAYALDMIKLAENMGFDMSEVMKKYGNGWAESDTGEI